MMQRLCLCRVIIMKLVKNLLMEMLSTVIIPMVQLNTEYNQLFHPEDLTVEGSHITENVKNGLIISKENAERNGIKLVIKLPESMIRIMAIQKLIWR